MYDVVFPLCSVLTPWLLKEQLDSISLSILLHSDDVIDTPINKGVSVFSDLRRKNSINTILA